MNLILLGVLTLPLVPFLIIYCEILFPFFLLAPFYSLPLLVLLKRQDIGTFSIAFQILALASGLFLLFKSKSLTSTPSVYIGFSVLFLACTYGLIIPQTNSTPLIVKLIACKVVLLPIIFSLIMLGIGKIDYICKIVRFLFWVCIANSIAGVIELQLGTQKLIAIGLPYGLQVREFTSGRVRALGLSLTNFEFSLMSGLTAILCYAVLSRTMFDGQISRILAGVTFICALLNMYTSITRQGILFPLIGIFYLELTRKRNAVRIFGQVYLAAIFGAILLSVNNLFVRSDTFGSRLSLWKTLITQFGSFIGNGIGFCGGATTSSFAKNISQIFVDNYYISIFLQLGVLGLCIYLFVLFSYFSGTNRIGKGIMLSITLISLITEFWEYTSVISLCLMFVVTIGRIKEKKPLSASI